jgi:hypothetical protein
LLAFSIVIAYLADWLGFTIVPGAILVLALCATAALAAWLRAEVQLKGLELAAFALLEAIVFAGLLWRAWPDLLLPGGGSDLAHHLQLVDYLDRHWRLVHDPAVEAYLGEMVHYTPGVHLLSSLIGRWIGRDGFHAAYFVVALTVAIKAGFVFLATLRLLPDHSARIPCSIVAVACLALPQAFVIGSFTRYSYLAQVVSEMFAVAMWWATIAWDEQPSVRAAVFFGIAGAGVFLTWPVWIGPPVLVFLATVGLRAGLEPVARRRTLLAALFPIAIVAAAHAIGRLAWAGIVRTDADMPLPTLADVNVVFLVLSAVGLAALTATRTGRSTALLIVACAVQAGALFMAAKTSGAKVPYMAIKMAYLTVYPLAAGVAVALASAWPVRSGPARTRQATTWLPWAFAVLAIVGAAAWAAVQPRRLPTVTEHLFLAGQWARANVPSACVDYVVRDENTAYWLHLAVLGNRRMSARTADDRTFSTNEAIVRWINPGGLPYAIVDLGTIPKDVLENTDALARFGTAAVVKRRGPSACADASPEK